MGYQKKWPTDRNLITDHLHKILNSDLFLLGPDKKPTGLIGLTPGNKKLSRSKNNVIPNIPELNLRIMASKLNRIIYCYKTDSPRSVYLSYEMDTHEELEDFEDRLLKFLEYNLFRRDELEPLLSKLIKKAKRVLKKKYEEDWYPGRKKMTEKQKWYFNLIAPLIAIFKKYLNDQATEKTAVTKTDIFYYISHLLIACGIEKSDTKGSHKPVFEKIRRYYYRNLTGKRNKLI